MIKKLWYFGLISMLAMSTQLTFAQSSYTISEDIGKAYDAVMSLRFVEAQAVLDDIKVNDPENLMVYHIENYIDFLTVFINEDKAELERLEATNKKRRLEKLKEGNPSSPYYRFTQAEVLLQWALARSKFYDDAMFNIDRTLLNDINDAYRLLEANEKQFPGFIANKKSLSVIHALAEYLPGAIKKLFKIRGSLKLGRAEIEEVVAYAEKNEFLFAKEADAIHAYMLVHLFNQPHTAWDVLMDSELDAKESPLAAFLLGTIGLKSGNNADVVEILSTRLKGEKYFTFPYLDFILGKAKLYMLDKNASKDIESYINNHKGRHFVKEAYQKLAWAALAIDKDKKLYKESMKKVLVHGHDLLEDDLQAIKEAKQKNVPDVNLLRARLLYDGGYFQRAYDELKESELSYKNAKDKELEYQYRMGRITHALDKYGEAKQYYLYSIGAGIKENSFFACNSALQLGLISEEQEFYEDSKKYFEVCLKIKPNIYKSQLHNKAKAGLNRIKKVDLSYMR